MGARRGQNPSRPASPGRSGQGEGLRSGVWTGRNTGRHGPEVYSELTTRPLYSLVFLLPLVIAYELGSIFYLTDPDTGAPIRLEAERLLGRLFETFGMVGLYLPGVALIVVLLVMHIARRDRWRIRPVVLFGMLLESALWTIPLLVAAMFLTQILTGFSALGEAGLSLRELPWQARLTVAIGAGLYEELVFRLIAIALIHFVAVDVLRLKYWQGAILAVGLSAAAFAWVHDLSGLTGGQLWVQRGYYFLAGLYFGLVYLLRGFGIVVGTHALYDVVVLVLLSEE